MSDAQAAPDGDPHSRRVPEAGGESLVFNAEVSAAACPRAARPIDSGWPAGWSSPEHPLTARVQVNRMWQHFFGTGIVKTSEDFGVQSEYPVHGALLDWLAVEFRTRGWSTKAMHRLIVTSATYRQSSRVTPEHRARDIENRLYARASRFRMSSLILRDWALAAAGLLDRRIGRTSRLSRISPTRSGRPWRSPRNATLPIQRRRATTSIAAVSTRSGGAPSARPTCSTRRIGRHAGCDRPRPARRCTPSRRSTTPPGSRPPGCSHEDSMKASRDLDGRLTYAFRRVLCRKPTDHDLEVLAPRVPQAGGDLPSRPRKCQGVPERRCRPARRITRHHRARRALGRLPGDPQPG